VSALEAEPVAALAVAVTLATPTIIAVLQVPGSTQDKSLSSVNAPTAGVLSCPYKVVRVRGIIWIPSGNAAGIITGVQLQRGQLLGGSVVGAGTQTYQQSIVANTGIPIALEWYDNTPTGLSYVLVAQSSTTTAISAIVNVTGFDG
jgi:hypothetical protein